MGRKNIQNPTSWPIATLKNEYLGEEGGGNICTIAVNIKKVQEKRK